MTRRLVCYKDVWHTEEGEVHPVTAAINHGLAKLEDSKEPKVKVSSASVESLSYMLKLYINESEYRRQSNVYQGIPFKLRPSEKLIAELLASTGNKFAHLEYVVKNEVTYECK